MERSWSYFTPIEINHMFVVSHSLQLHDPHFQSSSKPAPVAPGSLHLLFPLPGHSSPGFSSTFRSQLDHRFFTETSSKSLLHQPVYFITAPWPLSYWCVCLSASSFFKKRFYLLLEKGEGKEKDRERNINVWLPLARLQPGIWPATQACALTGIQTGDLLVCRMTHNPLSHTSQSLLVCFFHYNVSFLKAASGFQTRVPLLHRTVPCT